jgi:hypothetical protein
VYAAAAELVRTVPPALEALGVATARELDVETLASRIGGGAVAAEATVISWSLVGAAIRKPTA